jgi:hypothetical protein
MTSLKSDKLFDSASDAVHQIGRAATPAINESKRQAGVLLYQGGDLIDDLGSRIGGTAADLGKTVISYTKKNPLTALLLAVGAGVLLVGAARTVQSRR